MQTADQPAAELAQNIITLYQSANGIKSDVASRQVPHLPKAEQASDQPAAELAQSIVALYQSANGIKPAMQS